MERWQGKIAVVTGASSGIGASIAVGLANSGLEVIGFARRIEKIQALNGQVKHKHGKIHAMKFDLMDTDAIPGLFKSIKQQYGGIDILINNAGIAKGLNYIHESSANDVKEIFNTNIIGMVVCAQEAIKSMTERKCAGHIININSVLGHKVTFLEGLKMHLYPATKFAVTAFSDVLRNEMSQLRSMIKITSISPGIVKTEILEGEGLEDLRASKLEYIMPDDVTNAILFALSTPPSVLIQELTIRHVNEKF